MAAKTTVAISQRSLQKLLSQKFEMTPGEALLAFAEEGNLHGIQIALAAGAKTGEKALLHNLTGLHIAAAKGHVPAVAFLLDHGAPIDSPDRYGRTPLMLAALAGQTPTAQNLLKRGANVNATDTDGNTALITAAEKDHSAMVGLLLEKKADPNLANLKGETALYKAVQHAQTLASVKLLLENGARTNSLSRAGETPLSWTKKAAKYPFQPLAKEILPLLLERRKEEARNKNEAARREQKNAAAHKEIRGVSRAALQDVFGSLAKRYLKDASAPRRQAPAAKGQTPTR